MDLAELLRREGVVRLLMRLAVLAAVVLAWGAPPMLALELRVAAVSGKQNVLSVTAFDELGRPAPGTVVSFQLPATAPTGTFANGLRTEIVVADEAGQARVAGIVWDAGGGAVAVRVSASKDGARAATVYEWKLPEAKAALIKQSEPKQAETKQSEPKQAAVVLRPMGTAPRLATRPAAVSDTSVPVYHGGWGWGKKMLLIAAIAGGVAAAGYTVGTRQASAPAGASVVTPGTTPLSIGQPILTVGRP